MASVRTIEWVVCLNAILTITLSLGLYGCGIFTGTSYEEDLENDSEILREIIEANPVLDSVPVGHYFLHTSSETGRIDGWLLLDSLGLHDSNFTFPKSIQNFKLIEYVTLSFNDFTEVPRGIQHKSWKRFLVSGNKICNPNSETVSYLDKFTEKSTGGYWRDSQRCGDSL